MTIGNFPKPLHITLLLIALTVVSASANRILKSNPEPPALTTMGLEAEQDLLMPPMVINSTADTGPNPTPPPTAGRQFYVSSQGRSHGDGSVNNPWDLRTALSHPARVSAGDTIWLRGGIYGTGDPSDEVNKITSSLRGTEASPIVVRGYPGERAIVYFYIAMRGAWTTLRDLEFTFPGANRYVRGGGIALNGTGTKAINLLVYNTNAGISMFDAQVNQGGREIYGSLIWGSGHYDLYQGQFEVGSGGWRGNGSAMYAQNLNGIALVSDVIAFRNFSTGVNAYSSGGWADGFHVKGNTLFDHPQGNILTATFNNPIKDQKILNNYCYNGEVVLGYAGGNFNRDLVMTGNIIVAWSTAYAFSVNNWASAIIQNNKFYSPLQPVFWNPYRNADLASHPQYTWDNNSYYGTWQGRPSPQFLYYPGFGATYNVAGPIADWRAATGNDLNSIVGARPTGMEIFIRPNLYEQGRAHITIFNWDQRSTVEVDISNAGLHKGQRFKIVDAQNFFGPSVVEGQYDGVRITLPLNLTAMTEIPGVVETLMEIRNQPKDYKVSDDEFKVRTPKHTPSEFNVFVVLPRP